MPPRSVANPRGPVVSALRRAATMAGLAGKERTDAWLRSCAEIVAREGYQTPWPEAPAYKGPVVLLDSLEASLGTLTAQQLDRLRMFVRLECDRRGPDGMP